VLTAVLEEEMVDLWRVCRYSMVWAMGSIAACHTYRMSTDYGGYHLDFTG